MAIGVFLGLAIIAGVWWFQPLARPSLPRATLGLVVMPFVMVVSLLWEAVGSIAIGARVDVRAGRAFIQRGRGGCYMSREGMSGAFVEAVGDVPVELGLVGRLGHRRHLRKRETTVRVGVDPEIGVAELVDAIEACLGVRAEVRQVEGGEVGGAGAGG